MYGVLLFFVRRVPQIKAGMMSAIREHCIIRMGAFHFESCCHPGVPKGIDFSNKCLFNLCVWGAYVTFAMAYHETEYQHICLCLLLQVVDGMRWYKVRWVGYQEEDDTWEEEESFGGKDPVKDYDWLCDIPKELMT